MEWNSGEKKIEINSKTVIESTKLKFDSVKSIDKINWKDGKKRGVAEKQILVRMKMKM